MTVGEITGAVLLKLSGGEASSDISVWKGDITSLLAPAVNYVQLKQYFIDKRDEGERLVNHFMLQVDTLPILTDSVRKRKYFTLTKRILSLPNGRGLQFVGDVRGRGWIPLAQGGEDMQEHYEKFKKSITSYQPEGMKVYLWNPPPLAPEALVKYMEDVTNLVDTDEILLPSGGELEVINLIYEWISGQRAMPKDTVIDQKDKPTQ